MKTEEAIKFLEEKGYKIEEPEQNLVEKLVGNFDSRDWAKEFVKLINKYPNIPKDEETMVVWFSNAIMTGYEKGRIIKNNHRHKTETRESIQILKTIMNCLQKWKNENNKRN